VAALPGKSLPAIRRRHSRDVPPVRGVWRLAQAGSAPPRSPHL